MSDDEFKSLVASVKDTGLHVPIVLYENKILDGRHRARACDIAKVKPRYYQYDGDEPARHVIALNLDRRHLTATQRAVLAEKALPHLEEEASERQKRLGRERGGRPLVSDDTKGSSGQQSRAATEAGKLYGVSGASVARAKRVKNEDPDLYKKVEEGEITVNAAAEQLRERAKGTHRQPSLDTERGQAIAKKNKVRLEKLMAQFEGLRLSLNDFPVEGVVSLATEEEVQGWISTVKGVKDPLNKLLKQLGG